MLPYIAYMDPMGMNDVPNDSEMDRIGPLLKVSGYGFRSLKLFLVPLSALGCTQAVECGTPWYP